MTSTTSGVPSAVVAGGASAIADHGLVGDLRTAALVATDGTISWACVPRFDSPSIFASILDEDAGSWTISPVDGSVRTAQFYYPGTNILITRFMTDEGVVEVHDFMPLVKAHDEHHRQRLVRRVVAVRGSARVVTRIDVRPDYGRERCETRDCDGGVLLTSPSARLGVSSTVDLGHADGVVEADVTLEEGQSELFVLEVLDGDQHGGAGVTDHDTADTDHLFDATASFWRTWLAQSTYTGRWRETIERSALTLKLMTHEPSGAIVAAPTTSLPETIGGERNWDYRYVWVRDAAFSLYALLRLGFTDEAGAFIGWLSERLAEAPDDELGPLRVLYTIDGRTDLAETELDHLAGFRDSRPVRVGNGAVDQLQLDIYGELIDSVYLFDKYGDGITHATWTDLTHVLEWLLANWDRPGAGMWESRGEPQAHTSGRVMAWVAIERMMRIARRRGLPGDLSRWQEVRDEIYHQVMTRGWNEELQAFTQVLDGDTLDAAALLMPMVKMLSPADPRSTTTLEAIERELVSDTLVFRYPPGTDDGLDGVEGTFSICSFWYVEGLTRAGRLDDARLALEKMFTYANHLGLYAEQVGATGDQLGNFPQAFTHLSLISAAINLDRSLG